MCTRTHTCARARSRKKREKEDSGVAGNIGGMKETASVKCVTRVKRLLARVYCSPPRIVCQSRLDCMREKRHSEAIIYVHRGRDAAVISAAIFSRRMQRVFYWR